MRYSTLAGLSLACIQLCAGFCKPAAAGLVLSLQPSLTTIDSPAAGTTSDVTITIFLAADAGTESVLSYTIPVDLSPPTGTDSPSGFTVTSATARIAFAGQPFDANLNPAEGDVLASGGQLNFTQPLPFTTTPTALFDFTVAIDSTALPGDYTASIVRGALLALDPGFTNTAVIGAPATIRIRAIPEPAAYGLFGFVLACGLVIRGRRGAAESR